MAGIFRALVVDDDPDLLALIRLTLEYMAGGRRGLERGGDETNAATAPGWRLLVGTRHPTTAAIADTTGHNDGQPRARIAGSRPANDAAGRTDTPG